MCHRKMNASKQSRSIFIAAVVVLWIMWLRSFVLQPRVDPITPNEGFVDDYVAADPEPEDVERVSVEKLSLGSFKPILSIPYTGRANTKLVGRPGVPNDAFQWKSDYSFIKTGMDLPRIFPVDTAKWNETTTRLQVCVFNRTPRQRSLWATNVLAMYGSGKYIYKSLLATDCQFYGNCRSPAESRKHSECRPEVSPTVGLVEWVKCCFHDRFTDAMRNQFWDVAVATGDEYCVSQRASNGKADFRFYFSGNQTSEKEGGIFLPLGPREEFTRIKPKHVILGPKREYLFNFVGSMTSESRKILSNVLKSGVIPSGKASFLHIVGKWKPSISRSNGYILPHEYRKVLLNSTFTLCPDGHNPEAYRIYEALEAGSIPIVALDEYYVAHSCQHAFAPFIESGAPFVYLNSWKGLRSFFASVHDKPELLIKMQADAMAWYAEWMKSKAVQFEKVMEEKFMTRTGRLPGNKLLLTN